MPGCMAAQISPLQSKPVFRFCSWKQSCSLGNVDLRLSLPFWAAKSSTNLIQYVHCKPINQGKACWVRKHFLGSTGTHVSNGFAGMSCSRKGVFTVSAFLPLQLVPTQAILWAEDTRSNPLVVRHPVHGVLHGQCYSQKRLLGKLQCPAE